MNRKLLIALLFSTVAAHPAFAQDGAAAASEEGVDESEDIVVTGQRPRGSVVGDIPAENVLTPRDIRATGATSIDELLDAVATQTGSARGRSGGRPVMLLNGQRISSFREMRDIPPEAISRMEILPEEVALKYGYSADQRVVNIVLRERFNSTEVELSGRTATDGGYSWGEVEAGRFIIRNGNRTSLNLEVSGNNRLYQDERNIAVDPEELIDIRPYRTLNGSSTDLRLTGTTSRTVLGDVGASLNGELQGTTGGSGIGFVDAPLERDSQTEAGRIGLSLNGQKGKWRWSSASNAEISRTETESVRGAPPLSLNRSVSVSNSLSTDMTANGPLLALPAGNANATFKIGASATGQDSRSWRFDVYSKNELDRGILQGSINLDLPILSRAAAIGKMTANANAGLQRLSDFGTLTSYGAGLNWTPATRLNLIASWTREEGAPSLSQLGAPLLETPGVRFFDFVTNQTVTLTTVNGGNAALDADTRNVMKIGGHWQPKEELDLRIRAEFVRETVDNPQASFPAASAALEAAFPDRFTRDGDGNLIRVDLRPVNYDRSKREQVRIGFDFSKPLKSKPPSAEAIATMRERFRQQAARNGTPVPPAPPAGGQATAQGQAASPPTGGGGRGFGGGRFGGGNGGRLTFSLTDTITFTDEVLIRPGLPKLDYLDGEAASGLGGRARHSVEAQAGYYNNGLGARLSANWRSGTTVRGVDSDLDFSPYATFDLRLFANLGERFELVSKRPFFRGSSLRFEVRNIFNSRPDVRDSSGLTPLSYQPDLIEPIGRTVGISFRKLFIPRQFFRTQGSGAGGPSRGDGPPPDGPPPSGGSAPPPPPPGG